ncbi:hypothetical protein LINPERPRIM_LOCUS3537 [Linum perenne]
MSIKFLFLLLALTLTATLSASETINPQNPKSDPPAPEREPTPARNDPPQLSGGERRAETAAAEAPEAAEVAAEKEQRKKHIDKSVAGGGVILGGLITAVCMAVFCYIRVTRRRDEDLLPIVAANRLSTDSIMKKQQSVVVTSPAPALSH